MLKADGDRGTPLEDGGGPATDDTVAKVGHRIRELRNEQGLTLQSLAERTGLSSSMLSLVERGKASPSIGTLVAISAALSVHMIDLLNENSPKPSELVSRLAQQPLFVASDGVRRRVLKTDPRRGIEFVVNEYEPGTESNGGPVHHSGYEYGIVLEGELTVEIAGQRYEIRAGDCISFDSNSPHRIFNEGKGHVRALWLNLGR